MDRLTAASAKAGVDVRLDNSLPSTSQLPVLLGRTMYRIVQEALTNVHTHAPGASATVHLGGEVGSSLVVEVSNDACDTPSAHESGGDEVVDQVARHRPDVVVMDVRMPRMDGLAATVMLTALPLERAVSCSRTPRRAT